MKDFDWFKSEFEVYLEKYDVEYRFFEEGDFGSLHQVEFNTKERGGEIDFWSLGWLNIHFVDYKEGKELINILLKPHQKTEKEIFFKKLQELL